MNSTRAPITDHVPGRIVRNDDFNSGFELFGERWEGSNASSIGHVRFKHGAHQRQLDPRTHKRRRSQVMGFAFGPADLFTNALSEGSGESMNGDQVTASLISFANWLCDPGRGHEARENCGTRRGPADDMQWSHR